MAMEHRNSIMKIAQMSGRELFVAEQARSVHIFYIALRSALDNGKFFRGMFSTDSAEDQVKFAANVRWIR